MNKRHFLAATVLAQAGLSSRAQAAAPKTASPALLTVTGAIGKGNRGPLDPALDQMMAKLKIRFDKAHAFDFAGLTGLPAVTLRQLPSPPMRMALRRACRARLVTSSYSSCQKAQIPA